MTKNNQSSDEEAPSTSFIDKIPLVTTNGFRARKVDDEIRDAVLTASENFDAHIVETRPYKKGPGIEYAESVLNGLHNPPDSPSIFKKLFGDVEAPPTFSYELWYDRGQVTVNWSLPTDYWYDDFRDIVTGEYPKVGIERVSRQFIDIPDGSYVAGGTAKFKSNQYLPIKGVSGIGSYDITNAPEDRSTQPAPLRLLTSELGTQQNTTTFLQLLFQPARETWRDDPNGLRARSADTVANHLNEGNVVNSWVDPRIEDPTEKDKRKIEAINNHDGDPAFHVTIRYFAFAPTPGTAQKKARQIGSTLENEYHNKEVGQRFSRHGFDTGSLPEHLSDAITRDFRDVSSLKHPFRGDKYKIPLTIPELSSLAHVPNDNIETPIVNWTIKGLGSKAPKELPRKVDSIDALPYDGMGPNPQGSTGANGFASGVKALPAAGDTPDAETAGSDDPERSGRLARRITSTVTSLTSQFASPGDDADDAAGSDAGDEESGEGDAGLSAADLSEEEIPSSLKWLLKPVNMEMDPDVYQRNEHDKELLAGIDMYRDPKQFQMASQPFVNGRLTERDLKLAADVLCDDYTEYKYASDAIDLRLELLADDDPEADSAGDDETTDETENVTHAENVKWKDSHQQPGEGGLPETLEDYDDTLVSPVDVTREWQKDPITNEDRAYEISVTDSSGDTYIGRDVKAELFDIHQEHPESPLWLGWLKDNQKGVHEIGMDEMAWFRHMTVFGMTGTGKSTFINNIMLQIAMKGLGFCYIDPKGDGVRDIITQLPEERLDDIIWIEPGSPDFDKVVGINFLEAAYDKDHPDYDREVTAMVDDLTAILKGGDYWGPKMEGITTNIARAMIRSDIDFNLMDMYYVLRSPESREAFAETVRREGEALAEEGADDRFVDDMRNIHTYTKQIAEMDYDEVDAVVRRIQSWIEDPIARGVVAHREGTVNITEAVEDGKILLVNVDIDNEDIKGVIATAVMRRIWAAIKARREDEAERTPFFSFIDEFDDVATEEMNIEKMLSKARSGKMGVSLACQNPSQIPEAPRNQMFANVRTLNTFGIGSREDASEIATRFTDDVSETQVMDIPQYNIFTRVLMNTSDGPQLSKPLPVRSFADYPPVRSEEAAKEAISDSLEKYGVEPLKETLENSQMVLFNMGGNISVQHALLQAIWEVQIRRDVDFAALEAVNESFYKRTGREVFDYPDGVNIDQDWVDIRFVPRDGQSDPEGLAETLNDDDDSASDDAADSAGDDGDDDDDAVYTEPSVNARGEIKIEHLQGVAKITEAGKEELMTGEHGYVAPSDGHDRLVTDGIFEWFTRAGFLVNILEQTNRHESADAEGLLPVEAETDNLAQAQKRLEELEEEYPLLAEISDGKEVAFEAEYSLQKPVGPCRNVARAHAQNRRAIFMVPDGRGDDRLANRNVDNEQLYWANRLYTILQNPEFARDYNSYEDDEGNQHEEITLYNTTDKFRLSDDPTEKKFPVVRRDNEVVWVQEDGVMLKLYNGRGDDGKQRASFPAGEIDDATANAFQIWTRYDEYEDEWVVYPEQGANQRYVDKDALEEDWMIVRRPFHPQTDIGEDFKDLDPMITILNDRDYISSVSEAIPQVYKRSSPDDKPTLEPLIPKQHREAWDADRIPGYNPVDDTPEALRGETGNEEYLEFQSFLDRYEISSDLLDAKYPDTPDLHDPNHVPEYTFPGDVRPHMRRYWEKVFDAVVTDNDIEDELVSIQ